MRFLIQLLVLLAFSCIPVHAASQQPAANAVAEEARARDAAREAAANSQKAEAGAKGAEDQDTPVRTPGASAWEIVWSGQREMLAEIRETALKLSDNFSEQTENLSRRLKPFEEESRRLLVFVNTFKNYPNALEAVSRRMGAALENLRAVLEPVTLARSEAQGLLERVNYMASNLPDDVDRSKMSPEMQAYIQDISRARIRLTAALAQYDSLAPSTGLVKKLEETRAAIAAELPGLWKNYYMSKPVPWLNPEAWLNIGHDMYYSWQALQLRLPVELPATPPQWGTAILRFFIGLIFAGIIDIIFRRRWLKPDSDKATRHIFSVCGPLFVIGFALIGGAMSASGDFFRLFLTLGCLALIMGEIYMAWDLRRIQYPTAKVSGPPFIRLLPPAFCAALLFYLPLTAPLTLVCWALILVLCIFRRRKRAADTGPMQLEAGAMDCYPIILWLCLFLDLSGLYLYSMGLYLAYVAACVAIEFSLGGMSIVSNVNEHLPKEGARAVLARLLVALAAPFVLVLAVAGICLWVAMAPGGIYLLGEYALRGVSVGATQFNIFQALLIISAFYLTRTAVAMGTRFLAKLPKQGVHFDATLITPMQTALTYAAWAVFGLFALRSLGMELSNLAMVAGGLSVGIGFGMQTIVNNFLSGLILIFGRTLQVGDVVDVGGLIGRVRKISVRATMVETYDNAIIFVPNSEFMASRLINWTSFSRSVRCEVQVGVAYGSDTGLVMKLLAEIAKEHDNVMRFPEPSVIFVDFGASTLDFKLRFWVKDYDMGAATSSDIRVAIDRVFAEHDIEIAFPQLDVHLKDAPKELFAGKAKRQWQARPASAPGVSRARPFGARKPRL